MIFDGKGRNYIFGKTFMENQELVKWLEIEEFLSGIDELRSLNKDINDATILHLMNGIVEHHSEDTDGVFPLEWAVASLENYRKRIQKAYFDKKWLKDNHPEIWQSIQHAYEEENLLVVPFQMHKYVMFLKYFSERKDKYNLSIEGRCFGEDKRAAQLIIALKHLYLGQIDDISSLMKHLSRCNEVEIISTNEGTEIRLSVPDVFVPEDEFREKNKKKRAWTLQWNQKYIVNDEESPLKATVEDMEDD